MQLTLIFGIVFAITAVGFALQNTERVTISFAFWHFDSSLAMILLLTLGLGVIIAGLVSSPTVIKNQWAASRLRRQIADLDNDKAELARRVGELEAELDRLKPTPAEPAPEEPKPYVGLKTLIAGANAEITK